MSKVRYGVLNMPELRLQQQPFGPPSLPLKDTTYDIQSLHWLQCWYSADRLVRWLSRPSTDYYEPASSIFFLLTQHEQLGARKWLLKLCIRASCGVHAFNANTLGGKGRWIWVEGQFGLYNPRLLRDHVSKQKKKKKLQIKITALFFKDNIQYYHSELEYLGNGDWPIVWFNKAYWSPVIGAEVI